jgi:hypothetical protein
MTNVLPLPVYPAKPTGKDFQYRSGLPDVYTDWKDGEKNITVVYQHVWVSGPHDKGCPAEYVPPTKRPNNFFEKAWPSPREVVDYWFKCDCSLQLYGDRLKEFIGLTRAQYLADSWVA